MTAYLAQSMDRTEVRRLMGLDCRTDRKIVARIGKKRIDPQRLEDLCLIGVAEITFRRHPISITVVVDHLPRRVVWIGEGKSESLFSPIGPEPSREMETATLNLFQAYKISLQDRAPQAQIVVDRFPFQRLWGRTVDEVLPGRVRVLKGTKPANWIKDTRFVLLMNPWSQTGIEPLRLSAVQNRSRPLFPCCLLSEALARTLDWLQLRRAQKPLCTGLSRPMRSSLKRFEKPATTIKRPKDAIRASILCRWTTGLITLRAFGFQRAEPLDARFHPCCGGITLNPPLSFPTAIP